jgi:hypothetical protein
MSKPACLIAALLLTLGTTANADFVVVSDGYELALSDVRLPGSVNGTLTFRECKDCPYRTLRVTAATRYEANGQPLTLEEFRRSMEKVARPSHVAVTVLHHLESDTIVAVQAWF